MAAKRSVKASLPSLHDKPYPSLELCVPQAVMEETPVLHICDAVINVTFYYGAMLASVCGSSANRAVCVIRGKKNFCIFFLVIAQVMLITHDRCMTDEIRVIW